MYGTNETFLASAEVRVWAGGKNSVAHPEGTLVFLTGRFAVCRASSSILIDAFQLAPLPDYSDNDAFRLPTPAMTFCGAVESCRKDGGCDLVTVAITEYIRDDYMPFKIIVLIDHTNPRWMTTHAPIEGSPNSFGVTGIPLNMNASGQFTVSPTSITYNSAFSTDIHLPPTMPEADSINADPADTRPAKKRKYLTEINSMAAAANARASSQPSPNSKHAPQSRGQLHTHCMDPQDHQMAEASILSSPSLSSALKSASPGDSEMSNVHQPPAQNTRLKSKVGHVNGK